MRQGMFLFLCAALAACGSSSNQEAFHASMSSSQEVPLPTVNTPAPTGSASFTNNGDGTVSYTVTGSNMTVSATATPPVTYTGMHIHLAVAGVAAGITVPLTRPPDNTSNSFTVTGTFSGTTCQGSAVNCINTGQTLDTVLTAMRNGGAYLNVHTSKNTSGELRGQIQAGGQ